MDMRLSPDDGISRLHPLVLVPLGEVVDVRYEAMCRAIAECQRVDEVKEIHDKALALELYARQALNRDAERAAAEIRVRAEKRAGRLLREMAKTGARATSQTANPSGKTLLAPCEEGSLPTNYADAPPPPQKLAELGISYDQSSRWQKLDTIPDEQFEAVLADREAPLTTAYLMTKVPGYQPPPEPVSPLAGVPMETVMLIGFFREFAHSKLPGYDVPAAMAHIKPHNRDDLEQWTALLGDFLERVRGEL